jgi:tRNA pseudouridine32 synthase/23S rRNA pseudouridine746 synthase
MTSGALLFAKSPEAAREIIQKFRERKVSKYYVAISGRKPSKKMGNVIGDMTRGRRGSWMMQRTTEKPAITRFIATAVPNRPGKIAFLLKPETGRTHQLRVAMKAIGSPVLGDGRYANSVEAGKEARGYLHCAALRLVIGGSIHQVVCPPYPLPDDEAEGTAVESEFSTSGFQELFEGKWFHPELENDMGVWFPENKLLRSTPESLF